MRRTSLLASTGLLAGLLALLPAAPASAEEVHLRPADGTFEVEGHGWGHGRGMSQWGAQGAALLGRTADEITAHYYPGTARAVLPDTPIRVWLAGDEGRDTTVFPAQGLTVTDLATGARLVLPSGPSRWRVRGDASGLHLESLTGSTWSAVPLGGRTTQAGPVRFSGPVFTRVAFPGGSSRDYRGVVQAVRSGSALKTVVVLGFEDYLLGVVPREAPAGWRPAALQAQAIAARSYSAYKRERVAAGALYDICDTTSCQVFGGSRLYSASGRVTELEPASTTAAVRATAGVVRTWQGRPVFAEFSSSSGGWSSAGNVPYLAARQDPWDDHDANPQHDWTASLPVSALEKRFPKVGTLQRLRITARDGNGDWGGRIRTVVLEGTGGSVTTTGEAVRQSWPWPTSGTGMRSAWFRVLPEPSSTTGGTSGGTTGGTAQAQQAPRLTAARAGAVTSPGARPTGSAPAPVFADGHTVVLPRSGSTTVRLPLRNTGNVTWPGGGVLQVGTSGPRNRSSASHGSTWHAVNRVARSTGPAVAPGGTGSVDVVLHGGGRPVGVSFEQLEPLWAGRGWLDGAVTRLGVVRVDPAVARHAVLHSVPTAVTLARGGSTVLVVRLRNVGGAPWTVGRDLLTTSVPAPLRTSAWRSATTPPPLARNATRPGVAQVHPGEIGEWRVPLSAAGRAAGTYRTTLQAVVGGRGYGPRTATTTTVR